LYELPDNDSLGIKTCSIAVSFIKETFIKNGAGAPVSAAAEREREGGGEERERERVYNLNSPYMILNS
jgi:hypothetical protein